MGKASLDSVTGNSAVINVAATDNIGVTKYHVVDATNSIDALCTPKNGQITVTGLAGGTNYNFTITAKDAAGNESENSASVAATTPTYYSKPQAAATAPTWPADQVKAIYSPTYNADCGFGEWGSGTTVTDTEFGKKYVLAGGGYFGMVDFAINALIMDTLHFDIWIAEDATIGVVPIWGGGEQRVTVSLKGQQWNSINLAKEQYTAITDWSNIYQVKIDQASNLTFWMANAYFYRASAIEDDEAPTNVQGYMASAGYFSVTLALSADDNMGVVNFSVKNGETEVATGAGAAGATVNVVVPNLLPNTEYSLSVIASDDAGNAAEPIIVPAATLAAPAPADLPTYDAEKVQGVYTDNYTDVVDMGIQDWYAGPAISAGDLAENRQALCITPNTTPSSCFGLAFPAMDITAYDALELDIYPMAANAELTIQVIGVSERTTYELAANQWNHISLSIAGNTKTDCEQIGFYDCNDLKGVAFVQNVLFVQNGGTTAIENTEVSAKAIKMFENGQLVIIKNGVKYNALGAELR